MRAIFVIARREMASYFSTPLAYVFLIIFLAAAAAAPLLFGGFFERRQADLTTFFVFHPWLLLVLVPAIGMRLWAEERRVGTIELLMTLPITVWQAVLGKFLAAWAFAGLALALTFPIWVTVNMLGDPDNGVILASYIGSFLMAGAFLALSSAISALTTSQVVAFVLSVSAGFLLLVAGLDFVAALARNWLPQYAVDLIASYSLLTHFSSITEGVLEMRGIVFFLTIILLFLFINKELVELRKAADDADADAGRSSAALAVAAIVLAAVSFFAVNGIAGIALRSARADLTEDRRFTLTETTRGHPLRPAPARRAPPLPVRRADRVRSGAARLCGSCPRDAARLRPAFRRQASLRALRPAALLDGRGQRAELRLRRAFR